MLTIKSGRFSVVHIILFALMANLGIVGTSRALIGEPDEPTATETLTQAIEFLQQHNYDEAIDAMYSYLDYEDIRNATLPRVLKKAQDVRYRLAVILVDRNRQAEAIDVLKAYISKQPAPHMRSAMKMLVACYFDLKMNEEALKAVKDALDYNENPYVVAVDKTLKDDETFGDEEEGAEDLPYTESELTMLNFVMAESLFNLEKWEECIEPFTYVTKHTDDEQRKGYSIMQMINALISLDGFDRIISWVPELYKTPARYDIRVNLALLNAAATLYDAGQYDSALPLYRMIVPREELLEYQEKQLRQMRIDAGLPPDMGEELTPGEILLFGKADAARDLESQTSQPAGMVTVASEAEETSKQEVPPAITELEALIAALKDMQPYEDHVKFQMAQLYKNVQRFWEAVRFYEIVSDAEKTISNEDTSIYGRSVYELITILTDQLDEGDEALSRASKYFETHKEGVYPRLVAYVLTRHYQRKKDWKAVEELRPYVDGIKRSSDVDLTRYDTELYFMQGVAQLMQQHYTNAVDGFQYVINEFPGTAQEPNSLFWCGFSYLCLEEPDKAYECFERYTRDFPGGDLLDEAYYQGGIALFSLDRLEDAKERFSYVIDTYGTNSSVYSDACIMRADIYGSEGGDSLDKAVADYKNAFNYATRVSQATQATFKMCDLFKADENVYGLPYVEEAVNLYLARWGEDNDADIAKALFWIGRVMIQDQRYVEAADSYYNAIVDYGGNLHQDGVDQMIPELVKMCKVYLTDEQRDDIKTRLKVKIDTTDDLTLALRLRVVLAKLDDTEIELGKQLIAELPDFEHASPPVLSAICEASFANQDYSRAEELLQIFKNNFENSDYMRAAYKLRASGQVHDKDLDGALETIKEAQEEYGTDAQSAWAQLMKAQVLLDLGNIDEAREENKNVMGVPEWRGAPYAQATYQLGQVEEAAGHLLAAHGYYQRAYYQYKGLAKGHWGALGYLSAARCLEKLADQPGISSRDRDRYQEARLNTLRAMLYDTYVNKLPQADEARKILGPSEVASVEAVLASDVTTNIVVNVEEEKTAEKPLEGGKNAVDVGGMPNE